MLSPCGYCEKTRCLPALLGPLSEPSAAGADRVSGGAAQGEISGRMSSAARKRTLLPDGPRPLLRKLWETGFTSTVGDGYASSAAAPPAWTTAIRPQGSVGSRWGWREGLPANNSQGWDARAGRRGRHRASEPPAGRAWRASALQAGGWLAPGPDLLSRLLDWIGPWGQIFTDDNSQKLLERNQMSCFVGNNILVPPPVVGPSTKAKAGP